MLPLAEMSSPFFVEGSQKADSEMPDGTLATSVAQDGVAGGKRLDPATVDPCSLRQLEKEAAEPLWDRDVPKRFGVLWVRKATR